MKKLNNDTLETLKNIFSHSLNEKRIDVLNEKLKEAFKFHDSNYSYIIINIYNKIYYSKTDIVSKLNEDKIKDCIVSNIFKILKDFELLQYFTESDEEYAKILDLIKRRQLNGNVAKTILSRFEYFYNSIQKNNDVLNLYLLMAYSLNEDLKNLTNEYILNEYKELKEFCDKACSGVSSECFFKFKDWYFKNEGTNNIIKYIKDTYCYDFSKNNMGSVYIDVNYNSEIALSLSAVNDNNLWDTHHFKTIISFACLVEKYNDFSHAKKIIDKAFENYQSTNEGKLIVKNKLPLYLIKDVLPKIEEMNVLDIKNKLSDLNIKFDQNLSKGFVYPVESSIKEDKFNQGKNIFYDFIKNAYKNNCNEILEIFSNLDNIIQDATNNSNGVNRRELKLRDYLTFTDFTCRDEDTYKFLSLIYKNFGRDEAILYRFYYKCYIISLYANDLTNEYIYEYFFDLFDMISIKYNIKSIYITDKTIREKNYSALKSLLQKYNINISDNFKDLYIISLLDRKYASREEISHFAELEQFGDAIYDLAISNIYFYNPDNINESTKDHQDLAKAESQIKVSKFIGLDKLYISNINEIYNSKFSRFDDETYVLNYREHNYIADSLEMLLGVLAKEFNIQRVLDFAIQIIVESNATLKMPVKPEIDIFNDGNIDVEYLNKIYPAIYGYDFGCYSEHYQDYSQLVSSLNKVIQIAIEGNDTIDKRVNIAYSHYNILEKDNVKILIYYLYNGIDKTIDTVKNVV